MGRMRADRSVGVQVEGLRELNRALKQLGPEHQRELKDAGMDAANVVVRAATGLAYAHGGVAAKTAPSLRAHGWTGGAGVSMGGSGYPFAGGAEFGSIRYKQFQPWRGNGSDAGYFLYPAIRNESDAITEAYDAGLGRAIERAGLDE